LTAELFAFITDPGERRRATEVVEQLLRESEATLRGILDASSESIWLFSADGTVLAGNQTAIARWGHPADTVIGKRVQDLEPRDLMHSRLERIREAARTGRVVEFEDERATRRFLHTACPVIDSEGHAHRVAVFSRDITDRRRAEEALRDANQRLEEADRRKNEFLAILSHELRNPLTPIRNGVHLLERSAPGSDDATRALDVIRRQTHQLIHLVDDLLDVTRISRSKVRLQRRPLDLNGVVRRTIEDHRSLLEEKGIRVDAALSASTMIINGDEARVAQVVGNLLQNAAKFTPSGGTVTVNTTVDAVGAMAVVEVSDTGVGMEPLLVGQLFEPFAQADRTLDRTRGGLGLGLALVKSLTEMHGGRVRAHSDGPDMGSTFAVEFPLDGSHAGPPAEAQEIGTQAPSRVLVIEDNRDAADMLCAMLSLAGHEVRTAHDGADGIKAAQDFLPDVVLCDIGLPGMDGLAVARAFRADPRFERVALVALSGYALEDDLRRAADAGFDRHVAKPASPETIERLLSELAESHRSQRAG
jgi:PAS domain S-box-containing protein